MFVESSNDPETTKQSYLNTIDQLNQQLVEMKEAHNQLDTERQHLFNELQRRSAEAEQDQIRRTTGTFSSYTADQCLILVHFRESSIIKPVGGRFRSGLFFTIPFLV